MSGTGERPAGVSIEMVRLVAGRELRTRLRSKAYRISTIALIVLVIGFALVAKAIGGSDSTTHIGIVSGERSLGAQIEAAAGALAVPIQIDEVADESAGVTQLRDGGLDVVVVGRDDGSLAVVVDESLGDSARTVLTSAVGQAVLADSIAALGGDPAGVEQRVRSATVEVTALTPPPSYDPQRLLIGSVAGVLIYLALMFTGQLVAQGVVEEKSSRVVELLLATVRPAELMTGKVLGIGLVGLIQVAIVGVAGVLAGRLSGGLTISLSATIASVVWLVVWFVFGFVVYALLFGGLGALVSRQEDVGSVTAPAMMFLVAGYVIGISVLPSDPGNRVVGLLSLIPLFSPTLMPMRLAMGGVPLWQTLTALALILATIPLLVLLVGRLYRNAVIRTGERVRLRDALRA